MKLAESVLEGSELLVAAMESLPVVLLVDEVQAASKATMPAKMNFFIPI